MTLDRDTIVKELAAIGITDTLSTKQTEHYVLKSRRGGVVTVVGFPKTDPATVFLCGFRLDRLSAGNVRQLLARVRSDVRPDLRGKVDRLRRYILARKEQ